MACPWPFGITNNHFSIPNSQCTLGSGARPYRNPLTRSQTGRCAAGGPPRRGDRNSSQNCQCGLRSGLTPWPAPSGRRQSWRLAGLPCYRRPRKKPKQELSRGLFEPCFWRCGLLSARWAWLCFVFLPRLLFLPRLVSDHGDPSCVERAPDRRGCQVTTRSRKRSHNSARDAATTVPRRVRYLIVGVRVNDQ